VGDEELEDLLGKRVFGREHSVVWVREDSRLEDYGEVCKARHQNGVSEEKRERDARGRKESSLVAVMRFLSLFFSNTLRRSRT